MGGIYARNGVGRSGNWNGNRRYYNNNWNGNGHYRRHYRRHHYNNYYNNNYNDYYNGAGIFLGLGALGLGYGLGYYNNYPYYNNNYYIQLCAAPGLSFLRAFARPRTTGATIAG